MPHRATTLADYSARLLRAQALIEARLDDPPSAAELARAASFSLHHFHRIFRAQLGESVMEHARRLRLERAARRLRTSDAKVIEVALEAGYESHEAFTRAFSERFGVAPSTWRASAGGAPRAWAPERTGPRAAVRLDRLEARSVAYRRHHGSYAALDEFWAEVVAWAAPRGLLGGESPLWGRCPDDPEVTPESLLRFDACVTAPPSTPLDGGFAHGELPAGSYAVGLHVGPYSRLHETYLDVIGHFAPTSGHELADEPVLERYLDDPRATPPHELRTEIWVRLVD